MKNPIKNSIVTGLFVFIGIMVGVILTLQIKANPISGGSSPLDQLEIQGSLLTSFTVEQAELRSKLGVIEAELQNAQQIIERRSSQKTIEELATLRSLTGFNSVTGPGIKITITDSPTVNRNDFSASNESFVQATDIRDLINALFLNGAQAIAINGKRIMPLTSIQSAFDSILIDNLQTTTPIMVSAIGFPQELMESLTYMRGRKIQVYLDSPVELTINPLESSRPIEFMSL